MHLNSLGIRICEANYVDIMAINYRKLDVDSKLLATALCKFLAQIARVHTKTNKIASVAHSLGGNQGRSIIPTDVGTLPSERAPS